MKVDNMKKLQTIFWLVFNHHNKERIQNKQLVKQHLLKELDDKFYNLNIDIFILIINQNNQYLLLLQQSKLNKSSLQQQSIKVYVRVRPLLKKELGQECIIKTDQQKYVVIEQSTHILKQEYDQVFDDKVSQAEIFKFISPTIHKALQGYNTTIMAYGQTGSGKTHTMFGSDWEYSLNISLGHQSTFIDDLQTDQNHAGMIQLIDNLLLLLLMY